MTSCHRAAFLAAALVTACGPEDSDPPPPISNQLSIEVGGAMDAMTGGGGFRAIEAGAALPLRPGSQGGLHVYVNLRLSAEAFDAVSDFPVIYREGRRVSDGTLVSRLEHRTRLVATSTSGTYDTENSLTLFLCPTPVDIDVAYERIRLTVELRADYDEEVRAVGSAEFVPTCTDENRPFCERLCTW